MKRVYIIFGGFFATVVALWIGYEVALTGKDVTAQAVVTTKDSPVRLVIDVTQAKASKMTGIQCDVRLINNSDEDIRIPYTQVNTQHFNFAVKTSSGRVVSRYSYASMFAMQSIKPIEQRIKPGETKSFVMTPGIVIHDRWLFPGRYSIEAVFKNEQYHLKSGPAYFDLTW